VSNIDTGPSTEGNLRDGKGCTSRRRAIAFVASNYRPDAPSDVLCMDKGHSLRRSVWAVLAVVGIAVTAACSAVSAPRKSTERTVPMPTITEPPSVTAPSSAWLQNQLRFDPTEWQRVWATTPGSAARRCVQVRNRTAVRSNSFIVGNFRDYLRFWDGTIENSKLYYIPQYPEQTAPPLAVSAEPLDGQSADPPVMWRGTNGYAWNRGGPFYATGTLLAHRGRWRLVAIAGRNWGCFDLTL
jgi:hypothetical protein